MLYRRGAILFNENSIYFPTLYTQKSANGITKRWSFRKSHAWIWERTCALRLMEFHQQCLNGLKLVLIVSTNIYTLKLHRMVLLLRMYVLDWMYVMYVYVY